MFRAGDTVKIKAEGGVSYVAIQHAGATTILVEVSNANQTGVVALDRMGWGIHLSELELIELQWDR